MKITKGTWKVGVANVLISEGSKQISVGIENSGGDLCTLIALTGMAGAEDEPESIANAQLIAAAPEMYEALKAIFQHVESDNIKRIGSQCTLCHTYRTMARKALKKAEGE